MQIESYCRIINHTIFLNGKHVADLERIAGDDSISYPLDEVFKSTGTPYVDFERMSQSAKLAYACADLAIRQYMKDPDIPKPDVGMLLFSRASTMAVSMESGRDIPEHNAPELHLYMYSNPVIVCNEIAINYNLQGERGMYMVEDFKPEEMFDLLYSAFTLDKDLKYFLVSFLDLYAGYTSALACLVSRAGGPVNREVAYQRTAFAHTMRDIY